MTVTATLVGEFSDPDATALPYETAVDILRTSEMFWLSTVRQDARPHVVPLPAIWLDGKLHFATGPGEQKARNLLHNSACILTTGTPTYRSGIDVVVEGTASRVLGQETLERLAEVWQEKLGWQFAVGDGVFHDSTADGHPAYVFAVTPSKILAFTKDPYSQTRYVAR
jgi:hypothetical protein